MLLPVRWCRCSGGSGANKSRGFEVRRGVEYYQRRSSPSSAAQTSPDAVILAATGRGVKLSAQGAFV